MRMSSAAPRNETFERPWTSGASAWALTGFLAAAAVMAGGCSSKDVLDLTSADSVRQEIGDANRPFLILYYKDGCALCMAVEPVMNQLAKEYKGRVTVARYGMMTFAFIPRSTELMNKHNVTFWPTVILFDKGKEAARWVSESELDKYRKVLDKVAPPPGAATQPGATTRPATTQPTTATQPTGGPRPAAATRPQAATRPKTATRPGATAGSSATRPADATRSVP